jgi:DNA-binding response OmpR family regulator
MVRFGRCSVDVGSRVVELDGEERHLEPQAFDVLAYLLEHANRVIPKSELLDEVWGDDCRNQRQRNALQRVIGA